MSIVTFPIVESASAVTRLDAASAFLREQPPLRTITIVGATRAAADDLARRIALERPATFGITRLSLTQLAARSALVALAGEGRTPSTWLGAEAVATRAAFTAVRSAALRYFEPVAETPGFPRALARTLEELRLTGIAPPAVVRVPLSGRDLSDLLDRFEEAFAGAGTVDRADLFRVAARQLRVRPARGALLLLDVPIQHPVEWELVEAAIGGAEAVLATAPAGDATTARFIALGATRAPVDDAVSNDLGNLRRFLFVRDEQPPTRSLDGSLEFFSAPGEGRECVEIARRILRHARRGVRFDEMAILVRAPHSYFGLIEHALRRANVPAWFDRGTRRPHPAGRAFLAMLACAAEQLSAARFAEYLSLGQVPSPEDEVPSPWEPSRDDALRAEVPEAPDEEGEEIARLARQPVDGEAPVFVGTLRTPWRWEQLLGEAAVIGRTLDRWQRRLDGHREELARQKKEAVRSDGPESPRARAIALSEAHLQHLQAFALPIVEELSTWPAQATWGQWLERFEALAPKVLRTPSHVARMLADLRPMADVGPVDLDEARRVLASRLLTLASDPPARRFGRVFVGTPQQARGRSFRVVFVPGLAERMFPQKPREDPLLLDEMRTAIGVPVVVDRQVADERLLLQLAVGAAVEQLHVSYPRIELSESRARVPSFYALDLVRAATGTLPDHETLEDRAREAGHATLAWPAPVDPAEAIDDQEHDLAVLRRLLDQEPAAVRGHAHYLLGLNEHLRRSVITRWAHGQPRWSPHDGLVRVTPRTSDALASQRLTARAYSLSALQKFSACPYQFVLSAIYRLQPLERPEPLQRMDPLTRGSIFHDIQARFFRDMQARQALPVTAASLESAAEALDRAVDTVAEAEHDQLAPAVERVWDDEIASIRRDLHSWLHQLAIDGEQWLPKYFELAFGQVPGERDVHSLRSEVTLEAGFKLRGAIDLIEEHRQTGLLRVTDHKTGRKPDRIEKTIIGGGAVLQPVLYPMAVEAGLKKPVSHGRLFYCTAAGSFYEHPIPLNERTRAAALDVLQVIDRAIGDGFLAAAPADEACGRCEFQPVCGSEVARRIARKPQDRLADLLEIRKQP
jgi:CRISPR/Cas system-associated exonuclease Cas4 (RecB family)